MAQEHIVKAFDEQLNTLDTKIAEMGGMAESALADAIEALVERDEEKAEGVVAGDRKLDQVEAEVNALAMRMLALRQPMAIDLRTVLSALKISGDLERIGDLAKNIAKRVMAVSKTQPAQFNHTIAQMGALVQDMIKGALDAYVARDSKLAQDVWNRDEEVDQLHTSLFRELLTYMMEDPRNITPCAHLLFVAKNLERIGDHVTNIAERVVFLVEGKMPDERQTEDASSFTVVGPDGRSKSG